MTEVILLLQVLRPAQVRDARWTNNPFCADTPDSSDTEYETGTRVLNEFICSMYMNSLFALHLVLSRHVAALLLSGHLFQAVSMSPVLERGARCQ